MCIYLKTAHAKNQVLTCDWYGSSFQLQIMLRGIQETAFVNVNATSVSKHLRRQEGCDHTFANTSGIPYSDLSYQLRKLKSNNSSASKSPMPGQSTVQSPPPSSSDSSDKPSSKIEDHQRRVHFKEILVTYNIFTLNTTTTCSSAQQTRKV